MGFLSATSPKELQLVYGSFLHLETDREKVGPSKLLDLSKQVIKSPRNVIVGEHSRLD